MILMIHVRAKNVLLLRYFYTCFMLIVIVFLRFLFDFILFWRFWINVKKGKEMWEKDNGNAGNGKLDRIDSNSAQKPFVVWPKQKKKGEKPKPNQPHVPSAWPPFPPLTLINHLSLLISFPRTRKTPRPSPSSPSSLSPLSPSHLPLRILIHQYTTTHVTNC